VQRRDDASERVRRAPARGVSPRRWLPWSSSFALLFVVLMALRGEAAAAAPPAGAPPCAIWAGSLGPESVVLALASGALSEGTWLGEFGIPHTDRRGRLAGMRQGARWRFDELGARGASRPGATWFLEGDAFAMRGLWRSSDGHRTAPVSLRCFVQMDGRPIDDAAAMLAGEGTTTQQLTRLLRRGTSVETESTFGAARFKNAVDLVRGRAYLQLTALDESRGARPGLLRELNERIRQHVSKAIDEQREGRAQFGACDVETTFEVRFASPRYLTLATFDEWSCGTPAPEQSVTLETFDVGGERAVEVALADLYQVNRDARTKRAFWRMVVAAHEQAASGCAAHAEGSAHFELGLVQEGVLVNVDLGAYGTGPCDFSVILSPRDLKRFSRQVGRSGLRTSSF